MKEETEEICERPKFCCACSKALNKWQALTDDDVSEITEDLIAFKDEIVAFIREAEAKLKEKNGG
jgi:hypothetical protein